MNFPKVTKNDHGIRPAGRPDQCFYCRSMVGEEHKSDCVVVTKRVRLKATIFYDVEVPHDWDQKMIEFRYNDSTWCTTNVTQDIKKYAEKSGDCLCFNGSKIEFVEVIDSTPLILGDDGLRQTEEEKENSK